MKKIYTIGHSNKALPVFISKLKENNIQLVVDVRSVGFSKYNPQFNRFDLDKSLKSEGINYEYRGKNLGGKYGKEGNENYNETINELSQRSENIRMAVMCSEGDFKQCHRHYMLQPDFEKNGVQIEHILYDKPDRAKIMKEMKGTLEKDQLLLF